MVRLMCSENLLMLKTHIQALNLHRVNDFVYANMIWAVGCFWVFFCNFVCNSFDLISKHIFRFQVGDKKNVGEIPLREADQSEKIPFQESKIDGIRGKEFDCEFLSSEDVHEVSENRDEETNETESSVFMEAESDVQEDSENRGKETEESLFLENGSSATTSKYQYISGKDICEFIEEPKTISFTFQEFYVGPDVSAASDNSFGVTGVMANNIISGFREEEESVNEEEERHSDQKQRNLVGDFILDESSPEIEAVPGNDQVSSDVSAVSHNSVANVKSLEEKEFSKLNSEEESVDQEEVKDSVLKQSMFCRDSIVDEIGLKNEGFVEIYSSEEDDLLFNDYALDSDSESESSSSSSLIWANSNKIDDSITYEILADKNACEGFEPRRLKFNQDENEKKVSGTGVQGHLGKYENKDEKEELDHEEEVNRDDSLKKNEETRWTEKLAELKSEVQNEEEFDLEWEHEDLVEQLKMELKNARQGGLPTILEEEEEEEEEEETESPRLAEDLKPLKIEEKLEYKDQMDEIQKVYKSYEEKMRKLDILNYQTMQTIGLLELKDPLRLITTPKSTIPQNLWPFKGHKNRSDPLLKFAEELQRELELVYVGQVCLSWEILCWQHKKAQELKQYDPQEFHRYNVVAGEFQLFQVLMQRFIENEPFQGPRVQNYVKNRCVIRNLLQVPAIRDDCTKDKNRMKGEEEEDAIASGRLVEIIKESMRVFWEFVRADKDDGNSILKVSQQRRTDLDPAMSDLLLDIRSHQQKKERRLKDIVRSGNCIVKKFQKQHEAAELNHEQLLAQIELKLISRVLNMSRLRKDQLIWCNEKLNRIKFVNRNVQVDPYFLLFPC